MDREPIAILPNISVQKRVQTLLPSPGKPIRILLVAPSFDGTNSRWLDQSFRYRDMEKAMPGLIPKVYTVPLHLATVAALTPDEFEVRIWDEAVLGPIESDTDVGGDYHLVGVTGYSNHLSRARKIAAIFRARNATVVIGGAGVSSEPDSCRQDFDAIFIGESENTWPKFLSDFKAGAFSPEYRETGSLPLESSPRPRWDSIASTMAVSYQTGGIQVNRGCPFSCEFCDVWLIFGRKMRLKPVPQVLKELRALERFGMERVMFCSDNFVGDLKYAKELLNAVIPLNNSFAHPMRFFTELTLNINRDEEILRLLADSNFPGVFIGIESPNIESLKETRKRHNIHGALVDQCRKISSYGMYIMGSLIVGFDHDGPEIFDQQFEFVQEACIPIPRLNVLNAGKGTELRQRIIREGRLLDVEKSFDGMSAGIPGESFVTNIIPVKMTRVELFTGYLELIERVWDWQNFRSRVLGYLGSIERFPEIRPDHRILPRVLELRKTLKQFPPDARDAVEDIFTYQERIAPPMTGTVASLIALQLLEIARLPVMRRSIQRQIDLEEKLERSGEARMKLV